MAAGTQDCLPTIRGGARGGAMKQVLLVDRDYRPLNRNGDTPSARHLSFPGRICGAADIDPPL
jgi:hypothetical protein